MNITYNDLKNMYRRAYAANIIMGVNNEKANLAAEYIVWNLCVQLDIEALLLDREEDPLYIREYEALQK